ncbi:hypothetical protein GCM10007390_37910 [Persicitalea jodogahamensis]|uniref:Uncharacterized protein n=2 Tax=Persicitalea jodogahamensis TaxID=402147 RepID=A0A8J3DBH1_9BACT|nr:hypothetical protein [Persicitalea jodogahamensis]GHB80117.1 hypothetical protein GCM10007390_37910 [Persicitalea jodogahamensis]
MPDDFAFKIIWSTTSYDSETGKYSERYTYGDSVITAYLNKKELESIYRFSEQIKFSTFPPEFRCATKSDTGFPFFDTTIEMTVNSKYMKSKNTTFCDTKERNNDAENFDRLSDEISKILKKREKIKKMPNSDIMFM